MNHAPEVLGCAKEQGAHGSGSVDLTSNQSPCSSAGGIDRVATQPPITAAMFWLMLSVLIKVEAHSYSGFLHIFTTSQPCPKRKNHRPPPNPRGSALGLVARPPALSLVATGNVLIAENAVASIVDVKVDCSVLST